MAADHAILLFFVGTPEFSPEEAKEILNSDDFHDFFDKTTRIVERALNQPYDPTVDYAANDQADKYVSASA